jgi:hypothetical protein
MWRRVDIMLTETSVTQYLQGATSQKTVFFKIMVVYNFILQF